MVTSDWHMPRSLCIAQNVWAYRGVEIIPVEHPTSKEPNHQSDYQYLHDDRNRARLWRWLGVLVYWKSVADKRKAKLGSNHSWLEIGI